MRAVAIHDFGQTPTVLELPTPTLGPGEMFVVPKGTEHKPFAAKEVKMLLIEPRGTLNTGHEGGERTAENDVWI
jgi:mannose-6-phosphate isomerase-like protein (cupin superfamily)